MKPQPIIQLFYYTKLFGMQVKSKFKKLFLPFSIVATGWGISQALDLQLHNTLSNHPFLKDLEQKLDAHQTALSPEKVYVQFDKKFFKPSESIWFSVFVRDAQNLQKAESRVVYVELVSPKGTVEKTLILLAANGQASGDFQLAADAKGGIYKVRAYTLWQKNTNEFFERELTVQAVVLPNLSMKLDFEREAYGEGEQVAATLDLANLDNTPLANHNFTYDVSLDGAKIETKTGKTDANGRAMINYRLPQKLESNDGLVNVMLSYKGQTESISRSIPIVLGDIDLQFFPEGGELVAGQPCGLAFKAINEFGKPADVEGFIKDNKGNTVTTFSTYHQGMGSLTFTPNAGETYTAIIQKPTALATKYALPVAQKGSYGLRVVQQSKKEITVEITSPNENELFVAVQSRGKMYYSHDFKAKTGINTITIPTNTFPLGIAQVTLFDNNKTARAERLIFANPHKQLNVKVQTNKERYAPREKVNLTLTVTDENNKPVAGNFALSVVDDKLLSFADDKQGHILSAVLLESDLQGTIEEPNFYFDNENDPKRLKPEIDRQKALDNLLLTQGWRRFAWKDITNATKPAYSYRKERALVKGQVLDMYSKPLANVRVEATSNTLKAGDAFAMTNDKGEFTFDNLDIHGATVIKIVSDSILSNNPSTIYDFNENIVLYGYKKRVIEGVVLDKDGKALPQMQVYNYMRGTYEPTDKDGRFRLELIDNPSYTYMYIYDPAYKYAPISVSIADSSRTRPLRFTLSSYQEYQKTLQIDNADIDNGAALESITVTSVTKSVNRRASRSVNDVKSKNSGAAKPNNKKGRAAPQAAPKVVDAEVDIAENVPVQNAVVDAIPAPPPPPAAPEVFSAAKAEGKANKDEAKEAAPPVEEKEADDDEDLALAKADLAFELDEWEDAKPIAVVSQSRYYQARQFYAPKYEVVDEKAVRNDFRSTVYWNPNVQTDANGVAQIEFYNNDMTTQFRVTVEGFGKEGGLGRAEYVYFTQKAFEMVTKVPTEVLTGDVLNIPLTLTNNTSEPIQGELKVALPEHLRWVKTPTSAIALSAKSSTTLYLECEVLNKPDTSDFIIIFKSDKAIDRFTSTILSRPRGFPVRDVMASTDLVQTHNINVQQPIEGSISVKVSVYPSALDEVMKGLESMMRMPSGCFEQTSSSNYPNVLALTYLRETNTSNAELEKRAQSYLATGYQRLTGYESKGGGFHWWGYTPAHEALSAYGLMQFVDMQKVYPVDQALIDRTATWLLSRRDDKGGWQLNPNCLHTWAVSNVTDAYIVWAITEANRGSSVSKELDKSYKDAVKSEDPYMMALVANALFNVKDARANTLVQELIKTQKADGSFAGLSASVTHSTGEALSHETTSLAVLALLKNKNFNEAKKAVEWLQKNKNFYGYGSTQGTALALKAILEFTKQSKRAQTAGTIAVLVNGKQVATTSYKAGQKDIILPELTPYILAGKSAIEVKYLDTKEAIPYDISLIYNTRLPISSKECKVAVETALATNKARMGETVRLTTNLRNTSNQSVSMAMTMIGIPAGLSIQPWQLKEMQDKRLFDYYEIFDGCVVLHFERMRANELKTINFDLKADIPGKYESPASNAFLYYTQEHRNWVAPTQIEIVAAANNRGN